MGTICDGTYRTPPGGRFDSNILAIRLKGKTNIFFAISIFFL